MSQPQVKVGIMNEPSIKFIFPSEYFVDGKPVKGEQLAEVKDGKVLWNGELFETLEFHHSQRPNGS